jgi:hypothetical protein
MKEKKPKKNSSEAKSNISISSIFRTYISMIVLTHKNVGALRIIAAYYFIIFALISFWFTISVPVTSEFKPPEGGEKVISRLISGGMIIANVIAYGIMMTWKKKREAPFPMRITLFGFVFYIDISLISRIYYILIRIALISFVFYIDVFLISRILYILIREGRLL